METQKNSQKQADTQKRTLSRRAEAVALVCLIACLGALGLHAATQITTFDPAAATVGNARLLSLALAQYTLDDDEVLPPMHTVVEFQKALHPFVSDPTVFMSRVTGKPFVPNAAISGRFVGSFETQDTIALFHDTATTATVAFLDGHIERGGVIQGSPNILSYENAQVLALGIIQYAQDADEKYPPMKTQAAFQAALLPIVRSQRFFIDPLNGKPFIPNPALSGIWLSQINDPAHTIALQSDTPYPTGVPTIAYADGHVTPAPFVSPQAASNRDASNLQQIGLATIQYTQDAAEFLPTTNNYATFMDVLAPFTKDTSLFFSPGSGLPYILNPAISGLSIAQIDDPANTEEARDAQFNFDGTLNHLELDGHVKQDLYFVPRSLAVDSDNQTRLFWPKANTQVALWTIAPIGITKNTDTLSSGDKTAGFSVGADNKVRVLSRSGYNIGFFGFPITGAISLDTIGTDNIVESSTQFGPYDGWAARLLTTGTDNSSRLLWQHYDGRLALWTLSPEGDFLESVSLPRLGGGTPLGLALGADGLTQMLWKTAQGSGKLWVIAENGQVVHSYSPARAAGYSLTALSLGTDGASRILESDGKNHAVVVTLRANGSVAGNVAFTLPGGGTAAQIAVGKAGDLRVLWEAADGSGRLQTLTAAGKQTSVQSLTPYL